MLYVLENDGDDKSVADDTEQKDDWISDEQEIDVISTHGMSISNSSNVVIMSPGYV